MNDETAAQLHAMRPNVDPQALLDELDSWPDAEERDAGYALATADAVAWCIAHDFPAVAEALQRGAHRGAS